MAVPNPDYNPNWKEIHDFHDAERKRLEEERNAIQDQENKLFREGVPYDSDEMTALINEATAIQEQ